MYIRFSCSSWPHRAREVISKEKGAYLTYSNTCSAEKIFMVSRIFNLIGCCVNKGLGACTSCNCATDFRTVGCQIVSEEFPGFIRNTFPGPAQLLPAWLDTCLNRVGVHDTTRLIWIFKRERNHILLHDLVTETLRRRQTTCYTSIRSKSSAGRTRHCSDNGQYYQIWVASQEGGVHSELATTLLPAER